ncbi:hypothetical protein FKP32DRAFT_1674307 [Trametes sanguinea]|nr:hypothetical protein FKP32DRAFT_1674307 [Trametes sanguinea]
MARGYPPRPRQSSDDRLPDTSPTHTTPDPEQDLLDDSDVSSATKAQYRVLIADLKEARANSKRWNVPSPDSPLKLLHSVSRLIMRMHGPYLATSQAIALGITICAAPDLDEARKRSAALRECPEEQCAEYIKVTQWLLAQVPFLPPMLPLLEERPLDIILISTFIDHHGRAARTADISSLKEHLHSWVSEVQLRREGEEQPLIISPRVEGLFDKKRANWGWNSLWSARLLVWRSARDEFDENPDSYLIKLRHGHVKMNHKGLPSFLYAEHDAPPEHHPKYLFQGTLLMQAYRCIWTSPESASKEPGVGGSGRGSISRVNGVNSVRPANIAYVACLLRHVLSSEATWREQDPKVFNGARFYKKIIKFFTVDSCAKPILAHFQSCVYGEVDSDDEDADESEDEFEAAIRTLGEQHETSPSPSPST